MASEASRLEAGQALQVILIRSGFDSRMPTKKSSLTY